MMKMMIVATTRSEMLFLCPTRIHQRRKKEERVPGAMQQVLFLMRAVMIPAKTTVVVIREIGLPRQSIYPKRQVNRECYLKHSSV